MTVEQIITAALPAHESNPWWIAAAAVLYMLTGATVLSLLLRIAASGVVMVYRHLRRPPLPALTTAEPSESTSLTSYPDEVPIVRYPGLSTSFSVPAAKGFSDETKRRQQARPMLRLIVSASARDRWIH